MRASNERPYSIDCINACNFALGHNMLFIMQSIFTNWERRLAVNFQFAKISLATNTPPALA